MELIALVLGRRFFQRTASLKLKLWFVQRGVWVGLAATLLTSKVVICAERN